MSADTRLMAQAPTGAEAARPSAAAGCPAAASSRADCSGTRPRMPAPVARRTVAGVGSARGGQLGAEDAHGIRTP